MESEPLAKLTFWCLSPALIFHSLSTARLTGEVLVLVVGVTVVYHIALLLISIPLRRWLFPDDAGARAVTSLVLMFGNCGNLGLPVLMLALGREAFDVGVVFLATNTVLVATLGIAVATWNGRLSPKGIATSVIRVPWTYAVLAAVLFRSLGALPLWLEQSTGLLGSGAIPVMVVLLGMQLADVRPRAVGARAVWLGVLRLLLGSGLAWGLTAAFGATGVVRSALIVEGSVPTAVNSLILSLQYRLRSDLAASVLLVSTVLSVLTLSLTLALLGA